MIRTFYNLKNPASIFFSSCNNLFIWPKVYARVMKNDDIDKFLAEFCNGSVDSINGKQDKSNEAEDNEQFPIVFPHIKMRLSIVAPRRVTAYIVVKSDGAHDVPQVIGKTETIMNRYNPSYLTVITLIYHIGVKDHQKIIFEVYDDDQLRIGAGYLFATVELLVIDMIRSPSIALTRGDDFLGLLKVKSRLELHKEIANFVRLV